MDERGDRMTKLAYKPVSMLVGIGGGILASAIFRKVWKLAASQDEVPEATDASRSWQEILIAAALEGAIFATVRAAADRLAARGTYSLTGVWPGGDSGGESGKRGKREGMPDDGRARNHAERTRADRGPGEPAG
jgi:hypothetical protein